MLGPYPKAALGFELPNQPEPPNPWQVISTVVAALAAVASLIINWKGNRTLAYVFIAVALIVAVSVFYRPIAATAGKHMRYLRQGRIGRRLWPEFLRIEKRFGTFLNKDDSTNLRYILAELHGRREESVAKLCGPDYLPDYYALLRERHLTTSARSGTSFHRALSELHHMVFSYNQDYVLGPLRRLKIDPIVLQQLHPGIRESIDERMKAFREKWVRFLDDYNEFTDKINQDLRYDYREAIGTYFERPKTL
jgi:hypothetical protein